MRIEQLRLYHFRNYESIQLVFQDGIHMITGKNAQGKTNLLEALFYLSTTKSHRTMKDVDLIKEHEESFLLQADVRKKTKKETIRLVVNKAGKNLFLYQNPIHRVSDFIGILNAVMFCPDDMNLFQASPRVRRRFIDMELSKVSKTYTSMLNMCQRLLKERNAYLKQSRIDMNYLQSVTEQLISYQVIVMKQRYHFLQDLHQYAVPYYEQLSQDGTTLEFVYESCIPFMEDDEQMKQMLRQKYANSLERDQSLKQTTIGIHKEDFLFKINNKEVVNYASQGQKRSVLLAIKIGLVYMIEHLIHEYPILLLDDVFSELDEYRKEKLLASIPKEVQVFITSTQTMQFKYIEAERMHNWSVEEGSIVPLVKGGIQDGKY